jgi:hypothetical protein
MTREKDTDVFKYKQFWVSFFVTLIGGWLLLWLAGCASETPTYEPDAGEVPLSGELGGRCHFNEDCHEGLYCMEQGKGDSISRICTQSCVPKMGEALACGPQLEGACLCLP